MKTCYFVIFILLVIVLGCKESETMSPEEIIRKSIEFHDPNGEWNDFNYRLGFVTNLADSSVVNTTIEINNHKDYFRYIQKQNDTDIGIERDSCFTFNTQPINCNATRSTRNYWLFLWGQPMKLFDKGAIIDSIFVEENFEGYHCFKVKVQYPKDVWYFYFDKDNFALRGKTFYINEEKHIGEKMILSGMVNIDGMKFPEKREWINTHDSIYVATDKLLEYKKLNP